MELKVLLDGAWPEASELAMAAGSNPAASAGDANVNNVDSTDSSVKLLPYVMSYPCKKCVASAAPAPTISSKLLGVTGPFVVPDSVSN